MGGCGVETEEKMKGAKWKKPGRFGSEELGLRGRKGEKETKQKPNSTKRENPKD